MKNYLFLLIAIISEVVATGALKSSEGFSKLVPSIIVVIGYASAFYFLSLTLKDIPVGLAYAMWSGIGIVLISAFAWLYYGQKLDTPAMIGITFIIAGVVVINLFSKSASH